MYVYCVYSEIIVKQLYIISQSQINLHIQHTCARAKEYARCVVLAIFVVSMKKLAASDKWKHVVCYGFCLFATIFRMFSACRTQLQGNNPYQALSEFIYIYTYTVIRMRRRKKVQHAQHSCDDDKVKAFFIRIFLLCAPSYPYYMYPTFTAILLCTLLIHEPNTHYIM